MDSDVPNFRSLSSKQLQARSGEDIELLASQTFEHKREPSRVSTSTGYIRQATAHARYALSSVLPEAPCPPCGTPFRKLGQRRGRLKTAPDTCHPLGSRYRGARLIGSAQWAIRSPRSTRCRSGRFTFFYRILFSPSSRLPLQSAPLPHHHRITASPITMTHVMCGSGSGVR